MSGGAILEIECPRSAWQLLGATLTLYRRFPWLFLIIAAGVIVPYELIVLLATGGGPLDRAQVAGFVGSLVPLVDAVLIGPLVSALHAHAVRQIGDGDRPQLTVVARQSLTVLPVVSGAVVMSGLGTAVGLVALVVPGVVLWLRWAVAAPAAALESTSWSDALHRSRALTTKRFRHVLALLLPLTLASFALNLALRQVFPGPTTAGSFLAGTALRVATYSITALATSLLFFDLKARFAAELRPGAEASSQPGVGDLPPSEPTVAPTRHPLDPASYSDEGRPPGWYVDPDKPWRMRYWVADGTPGWSRRTSKTPKQTLAEWRDLRWRREERV